MPLISLKTKTSLFHDTLKYRVGLGLYDYLSGKLSLGKTIAISKENMLKRLPTLNATDLKNGIVYKDGQFDDARLAINLAQTIVEQGGTVLNYANVTELLKDSEGKINGVKFTDELSGESYEVKGTAVINATGVFMNEILSMDHGTDKKFVVPSQGIHLVLGKSFLPSDDALVIPKTSDGRVLFAVPWHDRIVVGTTDTLVKEANYEPVALEEEIQFILDTAGQYLTKKPMRNDVLSIFAGLRPLAAPEKSGQSTKEVSRSHKVIVSDSGLVTITGGKWTTYRQMSEDTVDEALKVHPQLAKKPCVTAELAIHGKILAEQVDLSNHLYIYGADIPAIKALEQSHPELAEKPHPNHPYSLAKAVWAAREEMVQSVEDVLTRRVRLLFLDARAAIDSAAKVAHILASELGKDEQWEKAQVAKFLEVAKYYLLVYYQPK